MFSYVLSPSPRTHTYALYTSRPPVQSCTNRGTSKTLLSDPHPPSLNLHDTLPDKPPIQTSHPSIQLTLRTSSNGLELTRSEHISEAILPKSQLDSFRPSRSPSSSAPRTVTMSSSKEPRTRPPSWSNEILPLPRADVLLLILSFATAMVDAMTFPRLQVFVGEYKGGYEERKEVY